MSHPQAERFREQARGCRNLGSRMYDGLLRRLADDLDAGGPSVAVLSGHEHDPGPSGLALRLLGSVHRLVLERRAGALAAFYPTVGGTWDPEHGWPVFRELLAEQPEAVREWLDRPPQTNDVGRSAALMTGLLEAGRRRPLPVRLFEIGSSGGLNLLVDRFRYVGKGGALGPDDAPVVLDPAWAGAPPPGVVPRVVERLGSDVMPIDVRSTEGRLALTAYVWPDQVARFERLRGAFRIASGTAYDVRRQAAGDFVDALTLQAGTTTVLWHSVLWQYVAVEERARILARLDELGAAADEDSPLLHLFAEPTRRTPDSPHEFLVCAHSWPGGGRRRILGTMAPHGLPVTVE
ncbi:DUF2332 domain-containing protein [Nocardioides cynanchi]|uniref:DUF2332 domain-containing protein n=1 Tax=Nocardioides cynanchi TaxID=2558918 RepID=UPI0012493FB6|nr:DUF2332 domain-containing protein [Nocardioides cynanchi]